MAGMYPIILIETVPVTHFKGISLSTHADSTITLSPDTPRATDLEKWAVENRAALDGVKACMEYNNAASNLANPDKETIMEIAKVPPQIDESKPAWIQGKITLAIQNESLWYVGCNRCSKKVHGGCDYQFHCMTCGEPNAFGTPRAKLRVTIEDKTGCLSASMFGRCAETLLLMTSKQIMETESQGKKASFQYANKRLMNEDYIIQLRSNTYTYQGVSTTTYTVNSLHDSSHHLTKKPKESPTKDVGPSTDAAELPPAHKRHKTDSGPS
ncbi:unnamed protein product, partial [Cuscuta epithymum]